MSQILEFLRYEDRSKVPGVCDHGSVPQSHLGNVVTRIGLQEEEEGFYHIETQTGSLKSCLICKKAEKLGCVRKHPMLLVT